MSNIATNFIPWQYNKALNWAISKWCEDVHRWEHCTCRNYCHREQSISLFGGRFLYFGLDPASVLLLLSYLYCWERIELYAYFYTPLLGIPHISTYWEKRWQTHMFFRKQSESSSIYTGGVCVCFLFFDFCCSLMLNEAHQVSQIKSNDWYVDMFWSLLS